MWTDLDGRVNGLAAALRDLGVGRRDAVATLLRNGREQAEFLAAFVQGRVDPVRVKRTAESRLASFKVPKIVKVVDELPRTATGKVPRGDLEDLLREGRRRKEAASRSARRAASA